MGRDKPNDKLRYARRRKMWTIAQAAGRVGISSVAYQRWEKGTQKPHLSTLKLLCDTFEATPEELGFGDLFD